MTGDGQDSAKRHSHPKPHNETGTAQFNGFATLFRLLSKVVPPKVFDVVFAVATLGGGGALAYWLATDVYPNFPGESFAVPEYVLPAAGAFAVGVLFAALRSDSQCPRCDGVFSLRRRERELERDGHAEAADELLVRREVSCSQCGYESEEKFWREESVSGME